MTPEIAAAVQDEPLDRDDGQLSGGDARAGRGLGVGRLPRCRLRRTPEVRVVAIQPVVEAPPPGVGTVKAFHDWVAGCDNRLGCTAIGLPPEGGSGGYVVLRLEAGAAAEPSLDFVLADPGVAGATMRVEVEGEHGLGAARARGRG